MSVFLLAGGGTAGHVNPLLATADEIRSRGDDAVIVLGTAEGLEARLVPDRGYELFTIQKVPFPRRLNFSAVAFPWRFGRAVARVVRLIRRERVSAVVGFGGYASAPAYVAAALCRIPLVFHEANARPGIANVIGARLTRFRAVAFPNTSLAGAECVGMPLRAEIAALDVAKTRPQALEFFGFEPDDRVLLVTGGSTGAARINSTVAETAAEIVASGWKILHTVGESREFVDPQIPGYLPIPYCNRMDLALAAAQFAVARSGAATVTEFAALGIPAVFVPYPVGNGEQVHNAYGVVSAGGGILCRDNEFKPEWVRSTVIPLLADESVRHAMATAAASAGTRDGASRFVDLVFRAIGRARA